MADPFKTMEVDFTDTIAALIRVSGRDVAPMSAPVILVAENVLTCQSRYYDLPSFEQIAVETFDNLLGNLDGEFLFTDAVRELLREFPKGTVYLREGGIAPNGKILIRSGVY